MSRPARLLIFGLVSAWLIKAVPLIKLFTANIAQDVAHPLFPTFFERGSVALLAYLAPIATSIFLFVPLTKARVMSTAAIFLACSGVLMLHANSHNDATFVCCFWASIWLLWLGTQWHRAIRETHQTAIFLGHAIIGMVFLGGFVGKLTPEYWSGEALFNIYFLQRESLLFSTVREHFDAGAMAQMAKPLARVAICCEGFLACAILLPPRLLAWMGIPIIVAMIMVASYLLYSVLGVLIFLILACESLAGERVALANPF